MHFKTQCNGSGFGRAAARYCAPRRAPTRRGNVTSSGDDEIDRFWALALLVGLDIEADALTLDQRFQPRTFNSGNVHEHVAAAVVGLDETVAAFAVEELDRTTHCHRATPSPVDASPSAPTARRLGWTSTRAKRTRTASITPPAPHRRRNVLAQRCKTRPILDCGKVGGYRAAASQSI